MSNLRGKRPPRGNYLLLKKFCQGQGISLFGVADIREIKNEFALAQGMCATFNKAVALGARLSQSVLEEIHDRPSKLYFHHYRTLNTFLDQVALRLVNFIQDKGFAALAIPASQIVDWEKQTSHLSHKKIGYLAGLGWIGRNNLLVNKKFGSQFRLVSVLTDFPLKPDKPQEDSCFDCSLCLNVCPAGAIQESVQDFNHQKCFVKLKEFQQQKIVGQYICGICVKACRPTANTL